jgi:hypothetical protein
MIGPHGFDAAIIGVGTVATPDGDQDVLVYDVKEMVHILMEKEGIGFNDALEFIHFNVMGHFIGKHGPCFVHNVGSIHPRKEDTIH